MISTVIIGSGNVAEALTVALIDAGRSPIQIFARNRERAGEIASLCGCDYESEPEKLAKAELYIVAVSDNAIEQVTAGLNFGVGVVAHTAGSVSVDKLPCKIRDRAVIYPLQTFTEGRKVSFAQIPIMIEGVTPKALESIRKIANSLSESVQVVDSKHRAKVHLAAVFACNFTNHMYAIGEQIVKDAGMDYSILKPLIMETALKAVETDSPLKTQTGPAVRNDFITRSLHSDMLSESPDLKSIYLNLSKSIWEISKKI